MPLEVIGAGWSRTGTFSLRKALGQLGFGPCYHMHEVFLHPQHHGLWRSAAAGELRDWGTIFADYRSVADAPACLFWRDLLAAYPDARVVLTVRNARDWYASMKSTVYETLRSAASLAGPDGEALRLARDLVLDGFFRGQFENERATIARFHEHNDAVRAGVPADRLLVYEVTQGWAPLCDFLGVPAPSAPFPNTNDRAQFRQRVGLPG